MLSYNLKVDGSGDCNSHKEDIGKNYFEFRFRFYRPCTIEGDDMGPVTEDGDNPLMELLNMTEQNHTEGAEEEYPSLTTNKSPSPSPSPSAGNSTVRAADENEIDNGHAEPANPLDNIPTSEELDGTENSDNIDYHQ